jgi:ParB family chromosome partitioning protein
MPDTAPAQIRMIPIAAIDADALARDRIAHDEAAFAELRDSIAVNGLRMPVEVFALAASGGPHAYGLISGFRRLAAVRALHGTAADKSRFAAIPAFVREPATVAAALAAMVEENAIRAEVSAWEQGMVAVAARDRGVFDTVDAAVEALYPSFSRQKRARVRAAAQAAEELDGQLTAPETLTARQVLRIASAVTRGYGDLIRHALGESRFKDPASQWRLILPVLVESETTEAPDPRPAYWRREGRPRRMLTPRAGLNIRREMTPDGWVLHFTGTAATGMLIDDVLDEIERIFSPG